MDLIDREALLIQIEISPQKTFIRNTPLAMDLRKLYSNVIKLAPTVDAVEAVYCRDCLWANTDLFAKELGIVYCNNYGKRKKQDDFCSEGERRGIDYENFGCNQ